MYETGTLLLYDRRGVYEIESVGPPPISGGGEGDYYKLHSAFSNNNEIIYIPVDTTAFMRPLISDSEVFEYFELTSQLEPQVFTSRKTTDLIAHYRDMLASCKVEDCLLLIKEIYTKQKNLAVHNKKLGQIDQQYLKLGERLICEEFAAVLDTTPDTVKKRLYASMRHKPAVPEAAVQQAAI